METSKCIEELNDILETEFDAVHAYTTAIKNTEDEMIVSALTDYLTDHNQHVKRITETVRGLGGSPKAHTDFKGIFLKGLTGVMSKLGDRNALRIMLQNEVLTNHTYDRAVEKEFPTHIYEMLVEFQGDERRHKESIERLLEWFKAEEEKPAVQPEHRPGSQP